MGRRKNSYSRSNVIEKIGQEARKISAQCEMFMITSKEYPECPKCDGINYPTFDHQTGKAYLKCYSCGFDSRKESDK